ncbi:MAG TPA: pilus assembly protein PilM [Verrucomicrobiae bacterium]|nr:pilus assembly protein PilM [Verrucomicrobiae bacterium]
MGLFGSNQVVGIDLGYASIRVVGLSLGKKPSVSGCAEIPVDAKLLQKDALEQPAEVAKALKEALKSATPHAVKTKEAYVTVGESSVFRKILEIPRNVKDSELDAVVRSAIVEFLPDDLDNLELDYQPLATPQDTEHQQMMVVAVSKKSIEQYLNLCELAGLTVRAIEPRPSALLRSAIGPKLREPIVVIDVGSEISTLALCADQSVWVASAVTAGSNMLVDSATGQVDEDKRAEKTKRLVGMLTDELDHVVKFYTNRASFSAAAVKEVRLCGKGSLIEGLDAALAAACDIKVTYAKPIVELPSGFDRRYMGALGSALYPMYELL